MACWLGSSLLVCRSVCVCLLTGWCGGWYDFDLEGKQRAKMKGTDLGFFFFCVCVCVSLCLPVCVCVLPAPDHHHSHAA